MRIVTVSFTLFVLIFGMVINILECPLTGEVTDNTYNVNGLMDSVYLVIITITTVGYGEITPHSIAGKLVMMAICLNGAIIISLFVVAINNNNELNFEQQLVFHQINQAQSASNVIKQAMRVYVTKRKLYSVMIQRQASLLTKNKTLFIERQTPSDIVSLIKKDIALNLNEIQTTQLLKKLRDTNEMQMQKLLEDLVKFKADQRQL